MILQTNRMRFINTDMISEFFLDGDVIKGLLEKSKKTEVVELAKLNTLDNKQDKLLTFLNGLKSNEVNLIVNDNVILMFKEVDKYVKDENKNKKGLRVVESTKEFKMEGKNE